MPQIYKNQPKRIPKLQHHKASGRGVVRLKGKDFYCGDYGTQACEKEYNRLIAEYLAGNPMSVDRTGYTIAELLADYLDYARNYYKDEKGKTTRSYDRCVETGKLLNNLYGDTPAEDFTAARFVDAMRPPNQNPSRRLPMKLSNKRWLSFLQFWPIWSASNF